MPRIPHPPAVADPGPVHWVDPLQADPDHPAVCGWQAHIAAGRIATASADPAHAAAHAANAALFARRRRERRA